MTELNVFDQSMEDLAEKMNCRIEVLADRLKHLKSRQLDFVARPDEVFAVSEEGKVVIKYHGSDQKLVIDPNSTQMTQFANMMGIPTKYLRTMEGAEGFGRDLIQMNLNIWLEKVAADNKKRTAAKKRNFLLRNYTDDQGGISGRAFLSSKFKIIDNYPIFQAIINKVAEVSQKHNKLIIPVTQSLTDNSMYLRFVCPETEYNTLATKGYKDPETGRGNGGIMTGFVVGNSEIGKGSLFIAPRLVVGACSNGQIYYNERFSKTHLGANMAEGVIEWSEDTMKKELELILSQIEDGVKTFLSRGYLAGKLAEIEELASIQLNDPIHTTKGICKDLGLTEELTDMSLNFLMRQGRNQSPFDVAQALTKVAQKTSPDNQFIIEKEITAKLQKIQSFDKDKQTFVAV